MHAEHAKTWKNAKHAAQWLSTLEQYAFPIVGSRRVDQVETPDVLKVLGPIWLTRPETARRVKQRLRTVLDWSRVSGFRPGENPVDGVVRGLPRQPESKGHHKALPFTEVPAFLAALRDAPLNEMTCLAFEFLVLTATRTSEVLSARWSEIDFEQKLWIIPGERMKTGREHRIPLSSRCLEILMRARLLAAEGDLIFQGRSRDKPLSNMAFLMALRRMKVDATAHGFRSAFRDWASERTNFPREVCEMALAHTIKDKVEAAYRRGDLLQKRRELMKTWAAFATSATATVVSLRTG